MWEEEDEGRYGIEQYIKNNRIDIKDINNKNSLTRLFYYASTTGGLEAFKYLNELGLSLKNTNISTSNIVYLVADRYDFVEYLDELEKMDAFSKEVIDKSSSDCPLSILLRENKNEEIDLLLSKGYPKKFMGSDNYLVSLAKNRKYNEFKKFIDEGYQYKITDFSRIIDHTQPAEIYDIVNSLIDKKYESGAIEEAKMFKSSIIVDLLMHFPTDGKKVLDLYNKEPKVKLDEEYLYDNLLSYDKTKALYELLRENNEKLYVLDNMVSPETTKAKEVKLEILNKYLSENNVEDFKYMLEYSNIMLSEFVQKKPTLLNDVFQYQNEDVMEYLKREIPEMLTNELIDKAIDLNLNNWDKYNYDEGVLNFIEKYGITENNVNKVYSIKTKNNPHFENSITLWGIAIQRYNENLMNKISNHKDFDLNINVNQLFYDSQTPSVFNRYMSFMKDTTTIDNFPFDELIALREKSENFVTIKPNDIKFFIDQTIAINEKKLLTDIMNNKEIGSPKLKSKRL